MNRAQLTAKLADDTGVEHDAVDRVLDGLEQLLLQIASTGSELRWPGLLTLDVVERAERSGRNPQTGETLTIQAGRQVRLRPGSRLKSASKDR